MNTGKPPPATARRLTDVLAGIRVRAWRLHLDTRGVAATVPILRGVWGAALHRRAPEVYRALFEGSSDLVPAYLLRPAPLAVLPAPAVDFLVFGTANEAVEREMWSAWDDALQTGLGSRRVPARLREVRPLAWDGTPLAPAVAQPGFSLAPLPWPGGDPTAPCAVRFRAPLRLLRDGKLIVRPTLADLTVAALRRLGHLVPAHGAELRALQAECLDHARAAHAHGWRGQPLDLVRYSGRQQGEVELRGVAGELVLPQGPGPLASLLLAAAWTHVGKGTVMGLGQPLLEPVGRVEG